MADSMQTELRTYFSAILLGGFLLNALLDGGGPILYTQDVLGTSRVRERLTPVGKCVGNNWSLLGS